MCRAWGSGFRALYGVRLWAQRFVGFRVEDPGFGRVSG